MVTYFVLFVALGFGIGLSFVWGLSQGSVWGLAALGELLLGYFIYEIVEADRISKIKGENND
jgi:hypothetical protein